MLPAHAGFCSGIQTETGAFGNSRKNGKKSASGSTMPSWVASDGCGVRSAWRFTPSFRPSSRTRNSPVALTVLLPGRTGTRDAGRFGLRLSPSTRKQKARTTLQFTHGAAMENPRLLRRDHLGQDHQAWRNRACGRVRLLQCRLTRRMRTAPSSRCSKTPTLLQTTISLRKSSLHSTTQIIARELR